MPAVRVCFRVNDDVTESAQRHGDPYNTKSQSQIPSALLTPLLHSLQIIVPMRVPKEVDNADILVNKGGTSILCAPRNATFYKPFYEFRDSFAFNSEYLNEYSSS